MRQRLRHKEIMRAFLWLFYLIIPVGMTYGQGGGEDCASADAVTPGTYTYTNITGTGINNTCLTGGSGARWYSFTPTEGGTINVKACGGVDTRLSVFGGTCAALTCLANNDDDNDTACQVNGYASSVSNVPVTAGQTVYIQWDNRWNNTGSQWTLTFVPTPACPAPTGAATTNVAVTTASFSWNAVASATGGYAWVVVPAGNSPTSTTVANGTTSATSTTATGLTTGTAYDFYVKSNCGGDGESSWAGPVNFTTRLLVAPPYSEGFATTGTPAGWTTTGWTIGSTRGATGNPGNNIYKNLFGTGADQSGSFTLVTVGPVASGMNFSFDYQLTN
ncbi:MAG: hypothetical protein ACFCUI_11645, partial [Bernardetiaceae bacterium]